MQNQFTIFEASFLEKISSINISSISEDKRVADYLQYLLNHKKYFVKIYSFVLNEALKKTNLPVNKISILDYGTGNGLLALYAKHCGFRKVYACDNYENFIAAAHKLSTHVGIAIDDWCICNEFDLFNKFSDKQIDIAVGTDVIEHIYDLNIFLHNIKSLNKNIIAAFTTASVYDNYFKRKKLEQLMMKDEVEYVELRKNIIQQYDANVTLQELDLLSKATRGLIKNDIIKYVDAYKKTGVLQPLSINNYNTCDPITGNFTERILTIEEYKILYSKHLFDIDIISGFYNDDKNLLLQPFIIILNFFISCFKRNYLSRTISPFIILVSNSTNKSV